MRCFLAGAFLLLSGCGPGLVFNSSQDMTPDEMLQRASLVFVGVIEKEQFEFRPFFQLHLNGEDAAMSKYWKILRRQVRIELVLRGSESRRLVDVYEISWTGGATGDWNSTQAGERALFLVRVENGRYHVVRDWWRSIFPVTTSPHTLLPLDNSHSLWERVALMNFWIERSDSAAQISYPYFMSADPGRALGLWRIVKLKRGLVRHPSPFIRVAACRELLLLGGWCQDECWDVLPDAARSHLSSLAMDVMTSRRKKQEHDTSWWWRMDGDREMRRLLTSMSNRRMRAEFCRLWAREYPDDHDNGCPADQPPPATIVREQGDIPLRGHWSR